MFEPLSNLPPALHYTTEGSYCYLNLVRQSELCSGRRQKLVACWEKFIDVMDYIKINTAFVFKIFYLESLFVSFQYLFSFPFYAHVSQMCEPTKNRNTIFLARMFQLFFPWLYRKCWIYYFYLNFVCVKTLKQHIKNEICMDIIWVECLVEENTNLFTKASFRYTCIYPSYVAPRRRISSGIYSRETFAFECMVVGIFYRERSFPCSFQVDLLCFACHLNIKTLFYWNKLKLR